MLQVIYSCGRASQILTTIDSGSLWLLGGEAGREHGALWRRPKGSDME